MAESAVRSASLWLGQLLVEEIRGLDSVTGKVENLRSELVLLGAFLTDAAIKRHRQEEVVRTMLSEAKNLAYDCEDVIEKYIFEVARHGYEENEGCQLGSAMRWACLLGNAPLVRQICSDIDKLSERFLTLKNNLIIYGVTPRMIDPTTVNRHTGQDPLRRIYTHNSKECEVVGLETQIEGLVERLLNPTDHTVIAICGMGGIGKSVLARELYHDSRLRDGGYFQAFGWCDVSQQFQPDDVLRKLIYKLIPENDEEYRKKISQSIKYKGAHHTLYDVMIKERCLVVLDDVWNSRDLARLKDAFPIRTDNGSRVVLTTRNQETISKLDEEYVYLHPVTKLNPDLSWELFEKTAFPEAKCQVHEFDLNELPSLEQNVEVEGLCDEEENQEAQEDFQLLGTGGKHQSTIDSDIRKKKLGRDMLQHCNGVPLAIVVLAKALKRKENVPDWEEMSRNISAEILRVGAPISPYKEVYDVLQVSYDELPSYLKSCFLHLANFPEDYEIVATKLFQLWISEGFIVLENGNSLTLEEAAEEYLEELVSRSMVEVGGRNFKSGRIETCRLHDLMRDVCIKIAKEQGFLQQISCEKPMLFADRIKSGPFRSDDQVYSQRDKRLRRIAVYVSSQESESVTRPNTTGLTSHKVSRAPNLRSLLLFLINDEGNENSISCSKFIELISNDFPLLRAVDCLNFGMKGKLSKEIGRLIHLRYLGLANTCVSELPSSIKRLQWLRTLDLRVAADIVLYIPNVLWKMKQLRHLYLPHFGHLGFIGREQVEDSPQRYKIIGGEKLRLDCLVRLQTIMNLDLDRVELQGLTVFQRMRTLSAICETDTEALRSFMNYCSNTKSTFMLVVHARILNEDPMILSNRESTRELELHSYPDLDGFRLVQPLCLDMLPISLVCLRIWYLELVDDPMPVLERLPNLDSLSLHWCYNGERMVSSAGGFPKLTDLYFDGLFYFSDWEVEQGAFPNIKLVRMYNCSVEGQSIADTIPSSARIMIIPRIGPRYQRVPEYSPSAAGRGGGEGRWLRSLSQTWSRW